MLFPNIFSREIADQVISRINAIQPSTQPQWGKMNAGQMFAHNNVTYEMLFTDKHTKPGAIARFMIKMLAKSAVTGPKPYKKNSRTAPQFVISDQRDFDAEKKILIDYVNKCVELGEDHFQMLESNSFGKLTKDEWNTTFYKHIDHHLTQFGV